MGTEIDDLYLILRAQYAPLVQGFSESAAAGEEMAAKVAASVTEVSADVERMAEVVKTSMGVVDESTMAAGIEFNRLQQQTMAAVAKMDAECNKAVASYERLDAAMSATPKRAGPSAGSLLLVAGAATAIGYEAVKMAGNFESSTNRLVTSAGEVQSNLAMVRQGILDMAGQVGDSAEQLSAALYTIESGGQHGADGLKVLRAAAEGAKAENADLTVVADAVTSVLQDYHLKASQAAQVTSELVAGVGAGKTTFQELAGSLHSVLPIASSAHVSLSDIIGDLASMTVHGMSADQAAQNLSDTIKHMVAPTGVQTKELGQLGMSSSDLSDMLGKKGLSGTLQYLSELILQHMGPSGRVMLNAFNQSKDAARDANLMIQAMPKNLQSLALAYQHGSITVAGWRAALKSLPPEQANLLQQFAALQGRASGFNDLLKSGSPAAQTYQDALRRVTGDATGLNTALMLTGENTSYVNGAIKTVAGATTEAGNHVKGWASIQGTFNQRMSEAKAGLGAVAIEVGTKLLPPVSKFLGILADGAQWLAKHQTLATILASALGVLAVGFTVAAAAVWVMNSALLADPLTWIILAVVAAVAVLAVGIYELVKHWGAVWGFIKRISLDVWHALVVAWHATWDAIKAVGLWIYREIILPVARFFNDYLVKPIKAYLDVIVAVWKFAWGFLSVVVGDFVKVWKAEWNVIASAALWVWNSVLKPTFDAVNRFGLVPLMAVVHGFVAMWKLEWHLLTEYIDIWWGYLKTVFHFVVDVGFNWIAGQIRMFRDVWNTVWSAITLQVRTAWGIIKPIFDAIGSALSTIMKAPGAAGSAVAHLLGFAEGGWVPGAPGQPSLAVVHGGEFVLSREMLANGATLGATNPIGSGSPAGGGRATVVHEFHLYIGGREIRDVTIREAQRYKGRNGHTGMS